LSLLLNIDTATEKASICLAKDGEDLATMINNDQKDHAAWLHVAIEGLMKDAKYEMKDLNAIAVSAGPGSYTGVRVGMAAAKGFCFALQIPLILESTLKVMTHSAILQNPQGQWFCPMIDARRMEVFTALYDLRLKEIMPPVALELTAASFENFLGQHQVIFFGNGMEKWEKMSKHPHATFAKVEFDARDLAKLSYEKYLVGLVADLAYAEPFYVKEFYSRVKN
jgi:tRNA threonylcarbamoyladenosine biosynthesis protein TsaB